MRSVFSFLIFLFISFSIFSQKTIERKFTLSNGVSKNVKIYIPKDYKLDTIYKYPLAIVLNDGYLFDFYKGNAKLYAESDLAPRQIVVGIETDFRTNKDVSLIRKNLGLTTSSKVFYKFIKEDLISYLQTNFKTSPFLSIIGHGKAANFALKFLQESKPIFNSYVFVSPNLTQQTILDVIEFNLKRLSDIDNNYFIYVSNSLFNTEKSIAAFNDLKEGLISLNIKNIDLKFDFFKEVPNGLTPISESIPRAYAQIFKLYRNISNKEYEEKIKDLMPLEAIKYLEQKYINLEYLYGTNLNVRLEDFYAIEGIVTDKQDGDYLRVLGDFALIKHPELPLGDYYLGRFYELGKDYERADEYYRFGYGKMDPSDPNTEKFYQNIERVGNLLDAKPSREEQEDEGK